jgi:hypothetical protein
VQGRAHAAVDQQLRAAIIAASLETRKATAAATSRACTSRPRGGRSHVLVSGSSSRARRPA